MAESVSFNPARPWYKRFRSSSTYILLAVCVAIFNDAFLFGTMIPILPYALPERLHIKYGKVQMCISILLASYAGAVLLSSLLGLSSMLVATLFYAFGRKIEILVLGRLLQGACASLVWTSSLGLLTDAYGRERYGEAVGYINVAASIGATSAPLLGGFVYSKGGWQAVAVMSGCSVTVALLLSLLLNECRPANVVLIPQSNDDASANQARGEVSQDATLVVNETGTVQITSDNTTCPSEPLRPDEESPLITGSQGEAVRTRSGSTYVLLLRSGRVLANMGGTFAYGFVMISLEGQVSLFVKDVFHWNPTQAALTYLAWIVPSFSSPLAGRISDRLGSCWVAFFGLLCTGLSLILLRLVNQDSIEQETFFCAMLAVTGFGLVLFETACLGDLIAAAAELQNDDRHNIGKSGPSSQAFGLSVFSFSSGGFIGPLIAGIVRARVGWGASTLILGGLCVAMCIPIVLKTSRRPRSSGIAKGSV